MSTLHVAQQLIAAAATFAANPMKRVGEKRVRVNDGQGKWSISMEERASAGSVKYYVKMSPSREVDGEWNKRLTGTLEHFVECFCDYGYARDDLLAGARIGKDAKADLANDAKDAKDAKDANEANEDHENAADLGQDLEMLDDEDISALLGDDSTMGTIGDRSVARPPARPPARALEDAIVVPPMSAQAIMTIMFCFTRHLLRMIDGTIASYFEKISGARSLFIIRGYQVSPPAPAPDITHLTCSVLRRRRTTRTTTIVRRSSRDSTT